jgi:Flp pilus assembly pilin Flp
MTGTIRFFVMFLRDDRGQDLIEYGLLASVIALAGYLLMPGIATKMGQAFSNWGIGVNNAWRPDPPTL